MHPLWFVECLTDEGSSKIEPIEKVEGYLEGVANFGVEFVSALA